MGTKDIYIIFSMFTPASFRIFYYFSKKYDSNFAIVDFNDWNHKGMTFSVWSKCINIVPEPVGTGLLLSIWNLKNIANQRLFAIMSGTLRHGCSSTFWVCGLAPSKIMIGPGQTFCIFYCVFICYFACASDVFQGFLHSLIRWKILKIYAESQEE